MAVFDDFHKITALTGGQAVGAPIVEDEKVRFHEGPEQPWEASVHCPAGECLHSPRGAMGQFEIGKETRQPLVDARLKIRGRLSRQAL